MDLIGSSGWRPSLVVGRRGRELNGSAFAPGSFSWPTPGPLHNLGMKKHLEYPPPGHVRKKLESRSDGTAVISFEWIAQGFTAVCFWTVLRRSARDLSELIAALEDRLRRQVRGHNALTGPIESE